MSKRKEELIIRPFKDDKTKFWVGYAVYSCINNQVEFVCGGIEDETLKEKLRQYLKI